MAKVVAKVRGYFGGMIREPGTVFTVPDDRKAPGWTRPYAFAGKGDHDGDGKTGGSKPAEAEKSKPADEPTAVVVPADWRNGKAAERKALAKAITGEAVTHATDADRIIEAYVEAQKPEAFSDAPEPETVKGNGVTEALGGVQPDWIAPDGDGKTGG
jgi:hypothetical protein